MHIKQTRQHDFHRYALSHLSQIRASYQISFSHQCFVFLDDTIQVLSMLTKQMHSNSYLDFLKLSNIFARLLIV
jgi:hypothetical protein